MEVRATTDAPRDTGADTIAIGVLEDEQIAHDLPGGELQALVDAGEVRKVAVTHADGRRWLLVPLGRREALTPEVARVGAARALRRAEELGSGALCWEVPHKVSDDHVGALVEGTLLGAHRLKPSKDPSPGELIVSAHHDVSGPAERAAVVSRATNRARDLQNGPANEVTPTRLADRAREIAAEHGLECEVLGREQIRAAGMGAFAAVAQGSAEEPALIVLRREGGAGPRLGLVGKAVTFDAGGISLKPGAKMSEMKFDMSGGAAVLEATAAICELGLDVPLVTVVGATENLPSGHAYKPGDILRAKTGKTIEVINTDAEGRLVLADCLAHALDCGAERLIDFATLTGGIITALGDHHAGLFGTDDLWCEAITAAGLRTGDRVWRLPLDPAYAKMIESPYADLANAREDRKATSIIGAEFLRHFTGDVPWAHVDIAGTAWDSGREYTPKGGTGFGVRLIVALAESEWS